LIHYLQKFVYDISGNNGGNKETKNNDGNKDNEKTLILIIN